MALKSSSAEGGAISRTLDRFLLRRRRQDFTERVAHALRELGLDESEFDERVQTLLAQICTACFDHDGEMANADALALEFFLRLTLEYPHLIERSMRARNVFVASIGVIRRWVQKGRLPSPQANEGIARIKSRLVSQLRRMNDVDDNHGEERMRAELHIREL